MKRVFVLWHGEEPVGICIFASPSASLALRSRYFGLQNARSGPMLQRINQSLWVLARVVLHPAYRGAGIAADFVARCCDLCPVPWVETLSAMGQVNPFFERAGFTKVGIIRKSGSGSAGGAYAGERAKSAGKPDSRSRFSEPVYYIRRRVRPSGQ